MSKLMLAAMGAMSVLAAGMAAAQPQERVQAGSLTCDISGGIGFIIVSQQTLTRVPAVASRAGRILCRQPD
jgi:hypothetical protein